MSDGKTKNVNWMNIQDWFLDRVLSKDSIPQSATRPLPSNVISNGYLDFRNEISDSSYQEALFDASRSMIRFKKPHRLIRMIDKIINRKVGVTHSAILIYDKDRRSYVLVDSRGQDGNKIPPGFVRLDLKSPIVELFRDQATAPFLDSGVLYYRDLKWILESGQLLTKNEYVHNKLRMALKEMELLDAELCVPCFFKKDLLGILLLGKKQANKSFSRGEMSLFATLANDAAMALANAGLIESLRRKVDEVEHLYEKEHQLFISTAFTLAKAVDARDIYTHGHTERVTGYCRLIAEELSHLQEIRMDSRFKEMLYITGLLHDIGKIGIPDSILNKNGKLTSQERKIVEKHPEIGANILLPIKELKEVAKCVRSHQEWHNGNGYPDGLKKDEIPLMSRIVSIADAFDAMTSDRPYRKRKDVKVAVEEIKDCSGTQFNPQVVEAFLKAFSKTGMSLQCDGNNLSFLYSNKECFNDLV
ncbi:MAG: HD-GYP domain-containing protein [Candidatus Omnitrophica bacterium]|nr:HD-GYP domain-containing protein [Candidatus Omnitrophota bacterium]